MSEHSDLRDAHAVVTGAASGIGQAAARCLKRSGCRVTAIDIQRPGDVADAWHCVDLNDPDEPLPTLDAPVNMLINAAGLPPRAENQPVVLRVNFFALKRLTLHLLPSLAPGGAIVNVASRAGAHWRDNIDQVRALMAQPNDVDLAAFVDRNRIEPVRAYDLSKEAVIAWTKAMTATLLDQGLRMNCVSPAAVETPILDDFFTALGDRAARGVQLTRRSGTAEEIGEIIAFLASPASEWIRGCNIETDGGLTAQLETEMIIHL